MRSAFVVLAAAMVLSLPALSRAIEKDDHGDDDYDRDRYDDGYENDDRDRGMDDRDYRDGYGGGYDNDDHYDKGYHDDDYDHEDGYHGDHGDKSCPDSFDTMVSFSEHDADHDDGVLCCKRIHHRGKKVVVCIDRDDKDEHDYSDHDH